jgi:hypothetical protein
MFAAPNGVYVLGNGDYLRIDSRARSIARLDVSLACVGHLVVVNIPITGDGRFVRRVEGYAAATVRIGGAFARTDVHLSLRVSGAGCDRRKVELAGRLS